MCGRFTVTTTDTKQIADRFQAELEKALARGAGGGAAKESVKAADLNAAAVDGTASGADANASAGGIAADAADGTGAGGTAADAGDASAGGVGAGASASGADADGTGAVGAGEQKAPAGLGRFNVAPTQEILTVRAAPEVERAEAGEREARLMRWGLVPRWAKDLKVGYRMINAKRENLSTSRAYGPLVGKFRHRCLIVADGFYEWMKAEDPKQPRQPWRFTVDGGEPFAFAGICTRKEWGDPGDRGFDDGWLYSATIVTTSPNRVVARVHDRMPAILSGPDAEAAWLSTDLSVDDAVAMCEPLDPARMDAEPANPKLNKVGKGIAEGPELLVAP